VSVDKIVELKNRPKRRSKPARRKYINWTKVAENGELLLTSR